ncbi:MAG: MazG family protein, partial [Nitrospirae bacterium]|nr:MazG family protein [Nitrospirota bacterium]
VMKKLDEEIGEFREAMEKKQEDAIEEELGDVLFMLVNISRFIGVNPEDALRKTISKFISRFRYIEMAAADSGRKLADMTLAEMDALWDEAKEKKK